MAKKRSPAQIAADKKRTGRPLVAESEKRNVIVKLCLTTDEFKQIKIKAVKAGLSLSEFLSRPWRKKAK